MQYLVHTSGEVTKFHNKAYIISAKTEAEAQEIAKTSFKNEFNCVKIYTETRAYTRTKRAVAACILMLIAIVISLFSYKYNNEILYFFSQTKSFSIAPKMSSCMWAIVFYCIYVIRFKGIQRTVGTPLDIAFCVLSVLLLSSVFQLILSTENLKFLWFIPLPDSSIVLTIAVITSLLGVKIISAGCMAFLAITAVSNLSVANEAMQFWGVIYVMCAFVGILLYLSVEPAVLEALPQIRDSFKNTFKTVKKDFSEAKDEAKTIINSIPKD